MFQPATNGTLSLFFLRRQSLWLTGSSRPRRAPNAGSPYPSIFFFRSPFGSAGSKKDLAKQEGWRRCVCDFKWFEDGNRFSGIQEFGSPNPPRQIHGPTCTRGPVLRKEGGNEVLLVRQAFIKLKWAEAQFKTQNLHILASSDTSCAQAGGIFGGSSQGVCEKMFAILCAFWFPRSFEWSLQADGQMHQKRRNNILRHICYK